MLGPMLLFRLRTIWKTVDGKVYPTALYPRPCPFWLPFDLVDAESPHWNTVQIRTGYQKLAWFILGRQDGAVLLGWNPQIARKIGKSHSFRWAILWIILLYMFFLNKRSNFEKKTHGLSYRSNKFKNCWISSWVSSKISCIKKFTFWNFQSESYALKIPTQHFYLKCDVSPIGSVLYLCRQEVAGSTLAVYTFSNIPELNYWFSNMFNFRGLGKIKTGVLAFEINIILILCWCSSPASPHLLYDFPFL